MQANRHHFLTEIAQNRKEQIFPWAAQGSLPQGVTGFMIAQELDNGFGHQTID